MRGLVGKRVVIAGGSGFLGTSLTHYLAEQGAAVKVLGRKQPSVKPPCEFVRWDGRSDGEWFSAVDNSDVLINLAGRTVDCIKTQDHCDEILRSRVESTLALGRACREVESPPPVWIQMSTAHIYGDPPEVTCTESSPSGWGFAPDVARAWEAATELAVLPTQRCVTLRASFVVGVDLGAGGGALTRLRFLASIGLGGRVGSGRQGFSWIHEMDMNRIFERAAIDPTMQGAYIASAPEPVAQAEFMRVLRKAVGIPIGLPSFAWMVRLGAPLVFRTDPELALFGRFVVPERLAQAGFQFRFPSLPGAIEELLTAKTTVRK